MPNISDKIESSYLYNIYEPTKFKIIVRNIVKTVLRLHKEKRINAIAFTGTSGAAVAYPVSYVTGIPLLCIRKSKVDNHYRKKLEGYTKPRNYIIIDDFVATGKTIKTMVKTIKDYSPNSKLSAVILYTDRRENTEFLENAFETKIKIVGVKR
jgi:adenine/guanine phosphoribosyltransferase-like PRPP-binding protein